MRGLFGGPGIFTGRQTGEGVEFFILFVGIGLALAVGGSGRYAILPRT